MSQYLLDPIAVADYDVAANPLYGGEVKVYMSPTDAVEMGRYEIKSATSGVYTPDPIETLPAGGCDLQVMVDNELISSTQVVVTVTGTDAQTGAALTGTATFKPPAYSSNQSFNFQIGYSVDVVPNTPNKTWATITNMTSTGGSFRNRLVVMQLPLLSSYVFIGVTTDKTIPTKGRVPKNIPQGMDSSAFTKKGMTTIPNVAFSARFQNAAEGVPRFDSQRCTVMFETLKDEIAQTDRIVMAGSVGKIDIRAGEGEGDAIVSYAGICTKVLFFVAPGS